MKKYLLFLFFGIMALATTIVYAETPASQIAVYKYAMTNGTVISGQSVTYVYEVINTGQLALFNVGISDDFCSPISGPTGDSNSNNVLETGESWMFSCTVTLYQSTTNTVIVTATDELGVVVSNSAQLDVIVEENNDIGCTFSQGYWKNHTPWVPMTNMPAWFNVATLQTPVKGNAWYQLAHQYIAACLNKQNGAFVPSEVQEAIDSAKTLLGNSPYLVSKANKDSFINAASVLGLYNEGLAGVPHCP
jgi:hypothetical protein